MASLLKIQQISDMGRLGSSHKKIDVMIVIQTVLAREVGNWDGVLPFFPLLLEAGAAGSGRGTRRRRRRRRRHCYR